MFPVPFSFQTFRKLVYGLSFVILGLGIAEALVWLFQCAPLASNFDYSVISTSCVDVDAARYC